MKPSHQIDRMLDDLNGAIAVNNSAMIMDTHYHNPSYDNLPSIKGYMWLIWHCITHRRVPYCVACHATYHEIFGGHFWKVWIVVAWLLLEFGLIYGQ